MTSSNGIIFPVIGHFCGGIHRSPVTSPHKGQWRGALMFSSICAWINGQVNNCTRHLTTGNTQLLYAIFMLWICISSHACYILHSHSSHDQHCVSGKSIPNMFQRFWYIKYWYDQWEMKYIPYNKNDYDNRITHNEHKFPSTWWRHQMETFSALLALCAGNSPVTGEFPTQRPVPRSFDVSFDLLPNINIRLSKKSWGWWFATPSRPLWRHCNGVHMYGNCDPGACPINAIRNSIKIWSAVV